MTKQEIIKLVNEAYESLLGDTDDKAWHSDHCYHRSGAHRDEDLCTCGLSHARVTLAKIILEDSRRRIARLKAEEENKGVRWDSMAVCWGLVKAAIFPSKYAPQKTFLIGVDGQEIARVFVTEQVANEIEKWLSKSRFEDISISDFLFERSQEKDGEVVKVRIGGSGGE